MKMSACVPSPWLLQTEPTLSPFFPQLGDKVVYCWRGHKQYINAVKQKEEYKIEDQQFPWQRLRLKPQEVCVVRSLHFVVGSPTLCLAELGILSKGQDGTSVHRTFSLRYHDMPDVPDFIVLYSHFKTAVLRKWTPGDRFQCKIDDAWWTGSIVKRQVSVPDILWQCFLVQWDDEEQQEKLSPWELELLEDDRVKVVRRGSLADDLAYALEVSGTQGGDTERKTVVASPSTDSEVQQQFANLLEILSDDFTINDEKVWGEEDEATARDRIQRGLDVLLSLPLSEPFRQPVNVERYPDYYQVIPYPVDFGTIRQRLSNGYYRRLESFLWDVKNISRNAATYRYIKEDSQIVKSADELTELVCSFASDAKCSNLMEIYNQQHNRANALQQRKEYSERSSKLPPQSEDEESLELGQSVDFSKQQNQRCVLQQQSSEVSAEGDEDLAGFIQSDEESVVGSSNSSLSSSAEETEEELNTSRDSSGDISVLPRTQRPSRYRRQLDTSVQSDKLAHEPEHKNELMQLDERNAIVDDPRRLRSTSRQCGTVATDVKETGRQLSDGEMPVCLPSSWLLQTKSTVNSFLPQLGDKVVYCWQGHELYINAVRQNNVYSINTKDSPWQRLCLKPHELCVVLNIDFVIGPPTLCTVTLDILSKRQVSTSVQRTSTFILKYHDMAGVPDFIIPYSHFKTAVLRNWTPGDRFQCKIDGKWWTGSIVKLEKCSFGVRNSLWQCILVQWDSEEEKEKLSPWDLEVLADVGVKPVRSGSLADDLVFALQLSVPQGDQTGRQAAIARPSTASEDHQLFEDLLEILSEDFDNDKESWGKEGEVVARERIRHGLDYLCSKTVSRQFRQPVSVEECPNYYQVIPYPVDLGTIGQRLSNRYYRRLKSFMWDVKKIHTNAVTYNEEDSKIVEDAKTLTELLCKFASDKNCCDLKAMYKQQLARKKMVPKGKEYQEEYGNTSDSASDIEKDLDHEDSVQTSSKGNRSRRKRRRMASSRISSLQAKKTKLIIDEAGCDSENTSESSASNTDNSESSSGSEDSELDRDEETSSAEDADSQDGIASKPIGRTLRIVKQSNAATLAK